MRHMASSRAAAVALTAVTGLFLLCAADFTFHLSGGLTDFLNDWVYDNVMLAAGAVCIARGIIRRGDRLAARPHVGLPGFRPARLLDQRLPLPLLHGDRLVRRGQRDRSRLARRRTAARLG